MKIHGKMKVITMMKIKMKFNFKNKKEKINLTLNNI